MMPGGKSTSRAKRTADRWRKVAQTLVIGYSAMGRTFAYIGIAPAKIFISEIFLGWFLLTRQDAINFFIRGRKRSLAIDLLRLSMIGFLLYGFFSLTRGYLREQPILPAVQNLAFNYYSLYLIIGLWIALQNPPFLRKLALWLGWFHGVYGAIWIVLLNRIEIPMPGAGDISIFGQPCGAAVSIIALLSYEPRFRKIWLPVLLN